MANTKYVTVATVQERFNLINYTPELNLEDIHVTVADVNRPALQLHGFYVDLKEKYMRFDTVLSFDIEHPEAVKILKKELEEKFKGYKIEITPDIDLSDLV